MLDFSAVIEKKGWKIRYQRSKITFRNEGKCQVGFRQLNRLNAYEKDKIFCALAT